MKFLKTLGHGAPVSRRDMLSRSAGLVSAAAFVPSAFTYLMKHSGRASAATMRGVSPMLAGCGSGAPAGLIPFLVFDLNGGASLPGNFLVSKAGTAANPGDLLAAYDVLGWDPRASGALDHSFGLPMAAKASQMLAGMRQTASAAALAKLRFGSFCHISQDDSSVNRSSCVTLASAAGLGGSLISGGVGTTDSNSGGNSDVAFDDPSAKPMTVSSLNDFMDAVSYGPGLKDLPPAALQAMADATMKMSAEQAQAYAGMSGGDQLAALSACGYQKNLAYASGPVTGIDPRSDAIFTKLYNLTTASDPTDGESVIAGIVMNSLRKNCGPGVVTINGCDYHTGSQADGDAIDLQIGQEIGRAVEAANQIGTPLFLQVLTDGGISADSGTRNWSGDAGDKGMTVIGYFNPAAAPTQKTFQVGAFTDGQSADRSTAIGSDPSLAAFGAFANYLNVCGLLGSFDDIVPGRPFDTDTLNSLIIFG